MADGGAATNGVAGAEIRLRDAGNADAPALAALGRKSFIAAFGHLYRPADLEAFLTQVHGEAAVAAEIADDRCIHQLAVNAGDGRLAGFCKLQYPSPYADLSTARNPIAIGQLYADPALTGRGIGASLMDWALTEAGRRGCGAVQLSVWSGNVAAQRFYERYGFTKAADMDFWVGEHRDDEFLYERRL